MFLHWHMHSIVRDFKRVKRKYRQTKGNPLKSHAQQALNAIKKSSQRLMGIQTMAIDFLLINHLHLACSHRAIPSGKRRI